RRNCLKFMLLWKQRGLRSGNPLLLMKRINMSPEEVQTLVEKLQEVRIPNESGCREEGDMTVSVPGRKRADRGES
ncbi:MAG: hypothetical protein NC432_12935, partial [Roseburia sp.]|nr:hypothetical protein [Roseburia sp.]